MTFKDGTVHRFVRRVAAGLAITVPVVAALLIAGQQPFAASVFEFGQYREYQGVLEALTASGNLFVLSLAVGLLIVTLVSGALNQLGTRTVTILGQPHSLDLLSSRLLYLLGMGGMILLLTSFYLVMPVGRISFRHALSGAVTATVLWEIVRRILVWYYSKLSLVNIIYGSLATTVVALLSIEMAVLILLLGAQVISEFDRRRAETENHVASPLGQ